MEAIQSFRDVIDLWPSKEAMALDLRAIDPTANASAVSKWWQRDSIPAEWWSAVLWTAKASDAGVSAEILTTLAARETLEARP